MRAGVFSNLNTIYSFGIRSVVVVKGNSYRNSTDVLRSFSRTQEGLSSAVSSSPVACSRSLSYNSVISRRSKHISLASITTRLGRNLMATSGSHAVTGDIFVDKFFSAIGNVFHYGKPSSVFLADKRLGHCQRVSLSLSSGEPSGVSLGCGHLTHGKVWRSDSRRIVGSSSMNASRFAAVHGAAHDVSFDLSSVDEQLGGQRDSSEQAITGKGTLSLRSGSYYLPHPDKEKTGGEDAHFICEEKRIIGVADGVGGWADVGVDAGEYARGLMSNSVAAIKEELLGSIDPAKVLEKAHSQTNVRGSSTACIIALSEEGIHAINLGDSGFLIIRDGSTVFRSPVQQYGFNFPYQLESGTAADVPSSGQVFRVPVAAGDVVVAGTDGLFDNLYNNEISSIVVHGVRTHLEPQVTAQKIAVLARERAMDKDRQTPFSVAAQHAGFRYHGGKLDDITVVVSYITASDH
ncbi:putative protein phosphatase 2C 55 [Drosera capensis]